MCLVSDAGRKEPTIISNKQFPVISGVLGFLEHLHPS